MKRIVLKFMLTALVAGMSLPAVSYAADNDLMNKIEQLSRELNN